MKPGDLCTRGPVNALLCGFVLRYYNLIEVAAPCGLAMTFVLFSAFRARQYAEV